MFIYEYVIIRGVANPRLLHSTVIHHSYDKGASQEAVYHGIPFVCH